MIFSKFMEIWCLWNILCFTLYSCGWIQHFRGGKIDAKNEHRPRCLLTVLNEQTFLWVHKVTGTKFIHLCIRNLFTFTFTDPLTTRVVWAPQITSLPVSSIFPCSPLPSGTWRTPGLSSHLFFCLPCLPPFTVPYKILFAKPDERDTCPYHRSLCLFTMVRRSSCGPIACWSWHRLPRW